MSEPVVTGLSETIQALRDELAQALQASAGEHLRFRMGEVSLELEIAISQGGEMDGGIRFGVVSFGGKKNAAHETTHRLKVALQPVTVDPVDHRGKDILISGWLPGIAE